MSLAIRPGWVCKVCAARVSSVVFPVGGARTFAATAASFRSKNSPSSKRYLLRRQEVTLKHETAAQNREKFTLLKRLIIHRYENLLENPERVFGAQDKLEPAHAKQFKRAITECCDLASRDNVTSRAANPLFWSLRHAFVEGSTRGLDKEINYNFSKFIFNTTHADSITPAQLALANFEHPEEWYPATRGLQRTVHLHVGPTNSGKTYNALQALRNAKSGIYAGPLRLLAHEVYSRFQAEGIPTALVTGEEQRFPDTDNYLVSCTVEMSPLNQMVDVAVIDEIQMIADDSRGWAWTAAVLGLMAKELHLCGEERAINIIQSICARTGDKLVVHRYERLNKLETMSRSLKGDFRKLEPGDAVVSFSRVGLWAIKRSIERKTGKRCAIVYGGLPPETRAQQAALFNDPDNDYEFLAASDAIGMGLNLSIKRIVFETIAKNDGTQFRTLTIPEVKQIGGRAGRFRTAAQAQGNAEAKGYVTSLEEPDLETVRLSFKNDAPPIKSAVLQLPASVVEKFAKYFPDTVPLSFILLRLRDICSTSSQYHLCSLAENIDVADMIQDFKMPIADRLTMLAAPVNTRDANSRTVIRSMARVIQDLKGGHLLDIEGLDLELLDENENEKASDPKFLGMLEALHRSIGLYLWLSYRYPNLFISQALAFHTKELLENRINGLLSSMRFDEAERQALRHKIRTRLSQQKTRTAEILGDDEAEVAAEQPDHEILGSWNEEGHEEPIMQNSEEAEKLVKPGHHIDPSIVPSNSSGSSSEEQVTQSR